MKARIKPKIVSGASTQVDGDATTKKSKKTNKGEKITAESTPDTGDVSRLKANAKQIGVNPYAGVEPAKAADGIKKQIGYCEKKIHRYADAAVNYAQLGLHSLAAMKVADAREFLGRLESLTIPVELNGGQDMHVGLWDAQGQAKALFNGISSRVDRAEMEVVRAARSVPLADDQGEKPWKKLVVLFGSSSNPPTGLGGHAGIADWCASNMKVHVPNDQNPPAARENQVPDEVWMLPVYKHIYASKSNLAEWGDRFDMAKANFEDIPGAEGKVKVMDLEKRLAEAMIAKAEIEGTPLDQIRPGSIDMVQFALEEYPDHQFVLMFGGDTFQDYKGGKWKGGRDLEDQIPMVAIPRKGVTDENDDLRSCLTQDTPPPELSDISSTKVRESDDASWLAQVLRPAVLEIMQQRKLFGFSDKPSKDME